MKPLTLVIGTRNYSSWSLRPWILLKHLGLPFTERLIHFGTTGFAADLPQISPTRRVPVLLAGELRVWESLAICEYASELADGAGWPADRDRRAAARAIATEMHSGFAALRSACPMNARARNRRVPMTEALAADLRRVDGIWSARSQQPGESGPWLFGRYCIADAMFAPVALRCLTYGLTLGPLARQYLQTVLDDAHLQAWIEAAAGEDIVIEQEEVGAGP